MSLKYTAAAGAGSAPDRNGFRCSYSGSRCYLFRGTLVRSFVAQAKHGLIVKLFGIDSKYCKIGFYGGDKRVRVGLPGRVQRAEQVFAAVKVPFAVYRFRNAVREYEENISRSHRDLIIRVLYIGEGTQYNAVRIVYIIKAAVPAPRDRDISDLSVYNEHCRLS